MIRHARPPAMPSKVAQDLKNTICMLEMIKNMTQKMKMH